MDTSDNWLLGNRLRALAQQLAQADDEAAAQDLWREADRALEAAEAGEDADIALPVMERSLEALQALVASWSVAGAHLPDWDRALLKRALKAYRKRLRLARLEDESSGSRNPLSKGDTSSITGVRPPDQYPPEVWAMLIAQGKLRDAGGGILELATI